MFGEEYMVAKQSFTYKNLSMVSIYCQVFQKNNMLTY